MLTFAAPAFARAMQGQMSDPALRQLSQALFNCAQPLEHRGPVAFGASPTTQQGGVLGSMAWNPSQYTSLFPNLSSPIFVEAPSVGGYRAGDWYSTSYGSPYFDLRSQLTQTVNNIYHQPAITVDGPAKIDDVTARDITTGNIDTETINGEPVDGVAGPAGPQGDRGPGGGPGPGNFFINVQLRGGAGAIGNVGGAPAPRDDRIDELIRKQDLLARGVRDLRRALKDLKIEGWPQAREIMFAASFDAENCAVSAEKSVVKLRIAGLGDL